jgi:hypothetical protein
LVFGASSRTVSAFRRCLSPIAAVVLVGAVATARAQFQTTIEVSTEQYGYVCQLSNDQGPGIRTVYVRHTFNNGSTASRFRVLLGPGSTMVYVSETHPFAQTSGTTQDGISICYGECLPGNLHLATISYMSYATDANCSKVLVVPHPNAQTVEALRCDGSTVAAYVRDLFILAPGGVCGCPDAHVFFGAAARFECASLPVSGVTWGAIKALYQN